MRCEEIMKLQIEYVSPLDTAQTAARKMRGGNLDFIPVCDAAKRVIGTVTDRDLALRIVAEGRAATTPIADVMTADVIACRPKEDLQKAEELMAKHRKSRMLFVDDDGRLIGVLSLSDIAQHEEGNRASQTLREVSQREARD